MQGKISVSDIKRIVKELDENFTDDDIKEMIDAADRDRKFAYLYFGSRFYWLPVTTLLYYL